MTRNLKGLMLAALALAALGAAAASAQANLATSHFTSNETGPITLTTTTDSHEVVAPNTTAKTSHQIFDIRKSDLTGTRAITCNELDMDNTTIPDAADGTTTSITATVTFVGDCEFLGQTVTVSMGDCDFTFGADGSAQILGTNCATGNEPITFNSIGCHVELGAQTIGGVKYHTIETGGIKMVTLEATNLGNIAYKAVGANCSYGSTSNGLFTTGNTIITGEKAGTQTMVNVEWKTGA